MLSGSDSGRGTGRSGDIPYDRGPVGKECGDGRILQGAWHFEELATSCIDYLEAKALAL